ncbi:MAG: FtsX-like permease family protein, partial [bacterium]|nr:FtsX-like permease family protein [bacterium]
RGMMFKNYLKIAFRNISRQKGFSFINIAGLAVGMTCCILILLWVQDELSYDRFHENSDTLYRVTEHQYNSSGDYFPVAVTPWPLAEALKEEYPEIVESARMRRLTNRLIAYQDKKFYEDEILAVDPSFLKMFSFPLIEGDAETALSEPNTVLITMNAVGKYFPDEDPIGKTIIYNTWNSFRITGILKDPPRNSHMKFDFLVQFESTLRQERWTESWGTNNYYTFVQLQSDAAVESLSEKVYDYMLKLNPRSGTKLIMQPVTDVHLHSDYAIDLYGATENTAMYVYIFSVIAVIILLIACINFMNLSTARSVKRAKEVGMRKVVGARKANIITQFYGESVLLTVISMLIALLLVYLLLPIFNDISGKELTFEFLNNPLLLLGLLGIALITGLLSGSYPALVQSSFNPVDSIKGTSQILTGGSRRSLFRRVLVVTQFTLSITLIIGTLVVFKQLNFMTGKDLGY